MKSPQRSSVPHYSTPDMTLLSGRVRPRWLSSTTTSSRNPTGDSRNRASTHPADQRSQAGIAHRWGDPFQSRASTEREGTVMGFSDRQMRALSRNVSARHIRSRLRDGKRCLMSRALASRPGKSHFRIWRLGPRNPRCKVHHRPRNSRNSHGHLLGADSDHGSCRSPGDCSRWTRHQRSGQSVGEVHDRALKAAETDATKRALATFGKAFGLALYAPRNPHVLGAVMARSWP
jgi:hypothetical protein